MEARGEYQSIGRTILPATKYRLAEPGDFAKHSMCSLATSMGRPLVFVKPKGALAKTVVMNGNPWK